jgi:hypothetical protein
MAGISELERQSQENEIRRREIATSKKEILDPDYLIGYFVDLCRSVKWKNKK